jgi:membrane protease YdiL (CAAX protease family)
MLLSKPWRLAAIIRLLVSVIVCIFCGSILVSVLYYHPAKPGKSPALFVLVSLLAAAFLIASLFLLRQPAKDPEKPLRPIFLLAFCFYSGLVLGAWAQSMAAPGPGRGTSLQLVLMTISFQGLSLLWTMLLLKEHRLTFKEAFGLDRCWSEAISIGIISACAFFPLGNRLKTVSMDFLEYFQRGPVKIVEQQAVETLRLAASWPDRLALGIVTILLVPVAEEILFRGIIYAWVSQISYRWLGVLISSLLFALAHGNLLAFLPLFLFAVMLALLYEKTKNLLTCITTHAVFNGLNFLMLYLSEYHFGRNG